jgi:threonine dehydratase
MLNLSFSGPPSTVADGLKTSLGFLTWPIIRDNIDDVITVTESEIISAMRLVMERMKIVIEPSAAVGVAAVLSEKFRSEKTKDIEKVAIILCGGNVNLDNLPWNK